jgi:hypothetical protein
MPPAPEILVDMEIASEGGESGESVPAVESATMINDGADEPKGENA